MKLGVFAGDCNAGLIVLLHRRRLKSSVKMAVNRDDEEGPGQDRAWRQGRKVSAKLGIKMCVKTATNPKIKAQSQRQFANHRSSGQFTSLAALPSRRTCLRT